MEMPKHMCACGMAFKQKKNLYAHMRKQHDVEPLQPTIIERNFECDFCGGKFCSQSTIIRHIRRFHTNNNNKLIGSNKKVSLACPHGECTELFRNYAVLRQHLVDKHNFCVEYEDLTFDSIEDFDEWKDNMQLTTISVYTRSSAVRTMKLQPGRRLDYNCHRSHTYKQRGKNLRAIKSIGTNKIGKACPSRLEVTYTERGDEMSINVRYWKTHCGHTHQIERLPLNKQIKCLIAEKLEEGYTFEETVEMIREAEPNDVISKRLQLLSRKDMYNILRDFNIKQVRKKRSTKANSDLKLNKNNTISNTPNVSILNDSKNVDNISTSNEIIKKMFATKEQLADIAQKGSKIIASNIISASDINIEMSTSKELKNDILKNNNQLLDKVKLLLDLITVVTLNEEHSTSMEQEMKSLIRKVQSSDSSSRNNLETKCTEVNNGGVFIKNEFDKNISTVKESLVNEIVSLLSLVAANPLSNEVSTDLQNRVNMIIKKAKLCNLDELSKLVNERIHNQVNETSNINEVIVKVERI